VANAMNFEGAPEWLRFAAIARKLPGSNNSNIKPGNTGVPGAYKPNYTGIPNIPSVTGNKAENDVLAKLYGNNASAYNKAKVGKKYSLQAIKAGDGFVHSDYGRGSAGAAIPYQIENKSVTRTTSKKADAKAYTKSRAKNEPRLVAEKLKEEAIKRRLNG